MSNTTEDLNDTGSANDRPGLGTPSIGGPDTVSISRQLFADTDAFAKSVADRIPGWEETRTVDPTTFELAAGAGLTAIEVPRRLGGLGLGFRHKVRVAEILSRTSMALAFSLLNTQNVATRLADTTTSAHRRAIVADLVAGRRTGSTALTEPDAGSDFAAITTTARKSGDGWILDGEKAWITNAATSDVIICYAQTDPGARSKGIAGFLVDGTRDGFQRHRPYSLSGGHLIGTGGFTLQGYRAGADDMLAEPGSGFTAALAGVNGARTYVAAMCNAMVHSALETAVEYADRRTAFDERLLDHQGLAWSLADVANKLEASQLLTDRAVESVESDELSEVILASAHAKKFATEMAEPAIAACIQAMGAEGLRDRYPLGRHLAEARIANFVDGSTQMQTERIARQLRAVYRRPDYSRAARADPAGPADPTPIDAAPPLPGDDHRRLEPAPEPAPTPDRATTEDATTDGTTTTSPTPSLPPLPPDSLRTDRP